MFDNESTVTVDGERLTPAQVATMRVALTNLLLELEDPDYVRALGAVGPRYKERVREVVRMLVRQPVPADVRIEIRAATERAKAEVARLDRAAASVRCGERDGATRVGGDGRTYACCCNLPAGHPGAHRFLGLATEAR